VSAFRLEKLFHAIRAVLEEAIEAGGSTLSDYAGVDGAQGGFQHRFRVYDREGEACATKGCRGTIIRAVHGGRSTFWCPRCQR
jgi:formamidopyrimidine-DNA glycosylase